MFESLSVAAQLPKRIVNVWTVGDANFRGRVVKCDEMPNGWSVTLDTTDGTRYHINGAHIIASTVLSA